MEGLFIFVVVCVALWGAAREDRWAKTTRSGFDYYERRYAKEAIRKGSDPQSVREYADQRRRTHGFWPRNGANDDLWS